MTAYYNEIDDAAAHILRAQIDNGVIAPGVVDTRSIKEVSPDDLRGFTQVHLFAGGGLWSVAARMAGWPDERPLWTGSCPCQGESLAGKRLGADDPRHLWPHMFHLIRACRPSVVMGEQVAAAAGTHWLDGVGADLEREDYAFRAVDLPACAVDAPHQRQRIYWIAVTNASRKRRGEGWPEHELRSRRDSLTGADALVQPDAHGGGRAGRPQGAQRCEIERAAVERIADGLRADADELVLQGLAPTRQQPLDEPHEGSFWHDAEWIVSPIDGKARRSKPGISFLVNGLPGRVDLWRVGGNAIVPQLAAEVIKAFIESETEGIGNE